MSINMGSIMRKLQIYADSAEGKKRMSNYISDCVTQGRTKTASNQEIITTDAMERAAEKLIDVLILTAKSFSLPPSIIEHFESLDYTTPYQLADGSYTCTVYFKDDLGRESLYSEGYDGVQNIIAVLNNGYHAQNYVYGYWEGHRHTGDNNILRQSVGDNFTYIRSLKDRDGLHFIQQAIDDFNGNFSSLYNATAMLPADSDYE